MVDSIILLALVLLQHAVFTSKIIDYEINVTRIYTAMGLKPLAA